MNAKLKWCTQCKADRPEGNFYKPKSRRFRCDKCNACVRENMRRYWKRVETNPDAVRRRAVDE